MRDLFEDIFTEPAADPMAAARRAMRPSLRARFYREVTVRDATQEDGFSILLDGRPVRTPAKKLLAAPIPDLAQRIAAEWAAQGETIDPVAMPLTRLANAIVDSVLAAPAPVAAEIEKYLRSDLVFYRASGPDGLVALQRRHWDPLMDWARDALGARFALAQGTLYVPQPAQAIAAAARAIPHGAEAREAWRLGALNVVTTLTGSALIALALDAGRLTPDAAWAAAHVDEDWNLDYWGRDVLALKRRAFQFAEMRAAATVLELLRDR